MKPLGQVAFEAHSLKKYGNTADDWYVKGMTSESCDAWEAAAQAVIAEHERRQWRPIEEAPKDGRHILAWAAGWATAGIVYWIGNGRDMQDGKPGWTTGQWDKYEQFYCELPTHWMPLPQPPKEKPE
jgi:hypothetical protein